MLIAADYPFLDILGTMITFFAWVVCASFPITVCRPLPPRRHRRLG